MMSLTLGPILFHWPTDAWEDFYRRIADEAPVDHVCVGEVVCSKRWPFYVDRMPSVIERLQRAGKTVLLSTLAMPTLERERRMFDDLLAMAAVQVEANDVSVLSQLSGTPHAIGPLVNIYNEDTLAYLASNGAVRACLPPELPLSSVAAIASSMPEIVTEVWAFGRVPLAISARCYHARVHGHTKDSCQFVCALDLDGLDVHTLDGEQCLAINGVQTLSHACQNLVGDTADLRAAGIGALRLSPQTTDMVKVARIYRDVLDGHCEPSAAARAIADMVPFGPIANGFIHQRPGYQYQA